MVWRSERAIFRRIISESREARSRLCCWEMRSRVFIMLGMVGNVVVFSIFRFLLVEEDVEGSMVGRLGVEGERGVSLERMSIWRVGGCIWATGAF